MDNILNAIEGEITHTNYYLSLVVSNDRFLYRKDIQKVLLERRNVEIVDGSNLELRIHFELVVKQRTENDATKYCYLLENNQTVLEDIKQVAFSSNFLLKNLFEEYSIEPLLGAEIWQLEELYCNKPILNQTKRETINWLNAIVKPIDDYEVKNIVTLSDAKLACRSICRMLLQSLDKEESFDALFENIEKVNEEFQKFIRVNYNDMLPSSASISPKIVSKILPYISFNYKREDKVALVVVDGMSYWQYLCLSECLHKNESLDINEDLILSWIPSITTLSRQAIFRGTNPESDYKQSPANEKKLWEEYWKAKGFNKAEVEYHYNTLSEHISECVSRLAFVTTDLDEKMHSSSNYADLYALTKLWSKREIIEQIERLVENGFMVYITTDHGNIETVPWRGLSATEKVGTTVSGSRSMRHIEYSDEYLLSSFIEKNKDVEPHLFVRYNTISISNNLSFSNQRGISHGGSHILETLIPFIKIKGISNNSHFGN